MALITAGAAILRLLHIGQVPPDPFYDAAVRSMTLSLHNFFFGVFEPGGSVSIDKPPVDLWLQVASVKLFGFTSTTLKLPEALAGIAAVPLLFAALRRVWSAPAAIAAAVAMAVLPIEVITSRSDTMDAVMMVLIVLALLLVVQACQSRPQRVAAGRCGRARARVRRQAARVAGGAAGTRRARLPGAARPASAAPGAAGGGRRPCMWSSRWRGWRRRCSFRRTNGHTRSARPTAARGTPHSCSTAPTGWAANRRNRSRPVYEPGHRYPVATQSERDHIPIVPPSPTRLLARIGPLSGERLGLELLVALLLGVPALVLGRTASRPESREPTPESDAGLPGPDPGAVRADRRRGDARGSSRLPTACACGARWRPDSVCGC